MNAITATYYDVENLLHATVHKFILRYGGDFDDLRSRANELFVDAYNLFLDARRRRGYDRAPFPYYVRYYLFHQLLEDMRTRMLREGYLPRRFDYDLEEAVVADAGFDIDECLARLSENARLVARLVWDTPIDIRTAVAGTAKRPGIYRRAIREYLRDGLGWSHRAITDSFNELRVVLSA